MDDLHLCKLYTSTIFLCTALQLWYVTAAHYSVRYPCVGCEQICCAAVNFHDFGHFHIPLRSLMTPAGTVAKEAIGRGTTCKLVSLFCHILCFCPTIGAVFTIYCH